MAKNTPGPWKARIKVEPFGIIGEIYADGTYLGRVDSSEVQSSAQEANAHLISAAPDMLEVLERLAKYCEQNSTPEIQGIACDAFQAINKAKGIK